MFAGTRVPIRDLFPEYAGLERPETTRPGPFYAPVGTFELIEDKWRPDEIELFKLAFAEELPWAEVGRRFGWDDVKAKWKANLLLDQCYAVRQRRSAIRFEAWIAERSAGSYLRFLRYGHSPKVDLDRDDEW